MKKNYCEAGTAEKGYCTLRYPKAMRKCRYYIMYEMDDVCKCAVIHCDTRNGCTNALAIKNAYEKRGK